MQQQVQRHPSEFADFGMPEDRARNHQLSDRAMANLLVTSDDGQMHQARVADLAGFVPANTVLVLNTSGTFFARTHETVLPNDTVGTIHFAHMTEDTALHWIIVAPIGLAADDLLRLPGGANLRLLQPYTVRGVQPQWEDWGQMWTARFESTTCFDHWSEEFASPIRYPYDTYDWRLPDMQNCFSTRPTSAMMNNGGRNLTPAVLEALIANGVQIATLEMRTGVGVDHEGMPLPEFVRLDTVNALTINAAINRGSLVLPVGTGVIRALDWFHDGRYVQSGQGWCTNVITPDSGTWLNAWVSGMHEPKSTHLAMGSAIMGEKVMRQAMTTAYDGGFMFHENGDTHLHLPRVR